MRYNKYTIVYWDGSVEAIRVPDLWSTFEVAEKLYSAFVFFHVPKNRIVVTASGPVTGPATVLVEDDEFYLVPRAPKTATEAYDFVSTYGPKPTPVE